MHPLQILTQSKVEGIKRQENSKSFGAHANLSTIAVNRWRIISVTVTIEFFSKRD